MAKAKPATGSDVERMALENRRAHVRYPLEVKVVVSCRDATGVTIVARGDTVNVGCGGLFALLDRKIPLGEGSDCLIQFQGASQLIRPETRFGIALRSLSLGDRCGVAIGFVSPVDLAPFEE